MIFRSSFVLPYNLDWRMWFSSIALNDVRQADKGRCFSFHFMPFALDCNARGLDPQVKQCHFTDN